MERTKGLQRHLTPLGAWALSIGCAVGWGSLVVTANTYLAQAGPAGSVLGLGFGALVMLLMAVNYAYLMRSCPDAGGAYGFTRDVFGHDHGFLTGWFLALTYFAILWANATSLPLFGRIFLGGVFRFGKLYTLFGYDVYLGEALLSMAALVGIGALCTTSPRAIDRLMIALACLFCGGIAVCFTAGLLGRRGALSPAFVPDTPALRQIVRVAVMSPWAFIGFEAVSHAGEEMDFDHGRIRRVLILSVISTLALYVLVTLLSVMAYPPEYDSWLSYIRDLDNCEGLKALPAFYAASRALGGAGVTLLMLSLLALVLTSLIGHIYGLSRLFYTLGRDGILPGPFTRLNARGVPSGAIRLTVGASLVVPLLGRTAIGWIVDVTTIGAILIYGLVSSAAARKARKDGNPRQMWLGRIGLGVMVCFGLYILLPNLVARGSLARETYFLFILWSVLGFLFFGTILHRDDQRRFGNSIIVWLALLALVLFISLIWMRQSMIASNDEALSDIQAHYAEVEASDGGRQADEQYIEEQIDRVERANSQTMLMALGMFAFALAVMLTNHAYMNRRTRESELKANVDPLTGVKSKHAYLAAEREWDAGIAGESAEPFSVVVCDVNGLKKINDTLGHKAGDEYIREACRMVCEIFKRSPVYRVGGDEFVALLSGRDYAVRKDLMKALHDRSVDHIREGGAVISGGCADYLPGEDQRFHDVFQRADELMYKEKQRLKSLGAVTRDDQDEDARKLMEIMRQETALINVRRHILIVEDEIVNQMLLAQALEGDYRMLYASDGVEALEIMRQHRSDLALVLMDLQMPRMGGIETLKAMREDDSISSIPVIVLTADQGAEVECLKLGAIDFIPKPYPAWEIVRARVDKSIELTENRDLIQSTERDSLTGLYNVDYFLRYVELFDRHYQSRPMDAMVLDVNHFHMINERFGKQYGDGVLKRVGERVGWLARELGGIGCRKGADAFLIYCPHQEDPEAILSKASEDLADEDAASGRVRLRMGVYANVDKTLDIERRFDRAKTAADSVRTGYVTGVGLYDTQMNDQALYLERLLEDFQTSLEGGHFHVYFQPKYNVRPEVPVLSSAEALVRWDHPELGMISPGVFIPLLEENGLILALDRFVWRKTAETIRGWKDRFGKAVPVSVNVSRIDMLSPELKDIFREILEASGLTGDDMILEITESAYTSEAEQVIATVQGLRDMGFRIEMDDFGTGYSSLGMLTHLPVDVLKLDMSFVRSAFGKTRDVRMIELILDIADYLHVPVVAEGVETEEQYRVLREMGCDLIQGYYFSKPVPAAEFERFLGEEGMRN